MQTFLSMHYIYKLNYIIFQQLTEKKYAKSIIYQTLQEAKEVLNKEKTWWYLKKDEIKNVILLKKKIFFQVGK